MAQQNTQSYKYWLSHYTHMNRHVTLEFVIASVLASMSLKEILETSIRFNCIPLKKNSNFHRRFMLILLKCPHVFIPLSIFSCNIWLQNVGDYGFTQHPILFNSKHILKLPIFPNPILPTTFTSSLGRFILCSFWSFWRHYALWLSNSTYLLFWLRVSNISTLTFLFKIEVTVCFQFPQNVFFSNRFPSTEFFVSFCESRSPLSSSSSSSVRKF